MARGKQTVSVRSPEDMTSAAVMADIKSEVDKQRNRLRFMLLLVTIVSMAYVVREAVVTPSQDPASVKCVRAEGVWHPETHDERGFQVSAYCGPGAAAPR